MNEYLTVDQAATLLHVSPTTVRRWIYQGSLKARKIRTGRNARVLIEKCALDELLVPVQQRKLSSNESRKTSVDRILALRRQFVGRDINVDDLMNQNRQERDRE
jgi:excisionase family DNA binding protein